MNLVALIKSGMSAPTGTLINGILIALPVSAIVAICLALLGQLIPVGIFVVTIVQLLVGYGVAGWLKDRP